MRLAEACFGAGLNFLMVMLYYWSSAGWMNEDEDKDMSESCARDMSMGMNDLVERHRAIDGSNR